MNSKRTQHKNGNNGKNEKKYICPYGLNHIRLFFLFFLFVFLFCSSLASPSVKPSSGASSLALALAVADARPPLLAAKMMQMTGYGGPTFRMIENLPTSKKLSESHQNAVRMLSWIGGYQTHLMTGKRFEGILRGFRGYVLICKDKRSTASVRYFSPLQVCSKTECTIARGWRFTTPLLLCVLWQVYGKTPYTAYASCPCYR